MPCNMNYAIESLFTVIILNICNLLQLGIDFEVLEQAAALSLQWRNVVVAKVGKSFQENYYRAEMFEKIGREYPFYQSIN